MKSIYFIILVFCFCSCNNKYGYLPIDNFTINQSALANHDTVEVVYSSGGPDLMLIKNITTSIWQFQNLQKIQFAFFPFQMYDFEHSSTQKVFISINSPYDVDKMIANQFGVSGKQPDKIVYHKEHDLALNKNIPTIIGYFSETSTTLTNE